MIYKCLVFSLVGCLAAVSQAAPCMSEWSVSRPQHPLGRGEHTEIIIGGEKSLGGVPTRGRKFRSADDLTEDMKEQIEDEMGFDFDSQAYIRTLAGEVGCFSPMCDLEIISTAVIEVIPVTRLSGDIFCQTETCTIRFHGPITISTIHSEDSFSAEVSSEPFAKGVSFKDSESYGFSQANDESTELNYEFNLKKGDLGYLGIVSAQISTRVRARYSDLDSTAHCALPANTRTLVKEGYHEAVVTKYNRPVFLAGFIRIEAKSHH
ncbi:hypothetical protein BGZ70_004567 [Mortierella alpina]|uniref:Uncharacterized protein n=1 Tax=Mortierella alpina TaxID=64518 RepID=A0A9P6M4U1_MORAP|nr:hypothetical protein BGZ70_004567 [Mortierella alpina]